MEKAKKLIYWLHNNYQTLLLILAGILLVWVVIQAMQPSEIEKAEQKRAQVREQIKANNEKIQKIDSLPASTVDSIIYNRYGIRAKRNVGIAP